MSASRSAVAAVATAATGASEPQDEADLEEHVSRRECYVLVAVFVVGFAFIFAGIVVLVITDTCFNADAQLRPGKGSGCRVKAVYKCRSGGGGAVVRHTPEASCGRGAGDAWQCYMENVQCENSVRVDTAAITLTRTIWAHPQNIGFCGSPEEEVRSFCQSQWPPDSEVKVYEYKQQALDAAATGGMERFSLALQLNSPNRLVIQALLCFGGVCMALGCCLVPLSQRRLVLVAQFHHRHHAKQPA